MTPDLLSGSSVWLFLSAAVVQVSILLILTILVSWLLRHRSPAVRHCVLLGALISVLFVPLLSFLMKQAGTEVVDLRGTTWPADLRGIQDGVLGRARSSKSPVAAKVEQPESIRAESELDSKDELLDLLEGAPPATEAISHLDWLLRGILFLAVIWFTGAAWGMLRIVHGWILARRLVHDSQSIEDEQISRLLEATSDLLGMTNTPCILASQEISTPLVPLFYRPVILLPAGIVGQLDHAQLKSVLVHEMAHIVRKDTWIGFAQRVVAAVWWPHPLVHLLNRMLSRVREELCDNYTIVHCDKYQYARTLLEVSLQAKANSHLALAVGLLQPKWSLEERVAGLLDESRNLILRAGRIRTVATLFLLGFGAVVISGAAVRAPSNEEAVKHIRSLGGQVSDAYGQGRSGASVNIPRVWSGTVADLDWLEYIDGITEIWFSGTEIDEVHLKDLPDLEQIIFNVNFYDNVKDKQVHLKSLPIETIRLNNLPVLERLEMNTTQVTHVELIDMPGLRFLEAEGLQVEDGIMTSVSGAPNLTDLKVCRPFSTVNDGKTQVTDAGLEDLGSLKKLRVLDLNGGLITDTGLRKLGELTTLESLSLASTKITDSGLSHLNILKNLRTIDLSGTAISDPGLRIIVNAHPGLTSIDLAGTDVTVAGLELLKGLPHLRAVNLDTRQLTEQSCGILDSLTIKSLGIRGHSDQTGRISGLLKIGTLIVEGISNLNVAPNSLSGLKNLVINGASSGPVHSLFKAFPYMKQLNTLDVGSGWKTDGSYNVDDPTLVDDQLMQYIADLKSLKMILIDDASEVGDAGIAHLAQLSSLEKIMLAFSRVTDSGVASLSGLTSLEYINLFESNVSNAGLVHFQKMTKLEELHLDNTNVDQDGIDRLKVELPDTTIQAYQHDEW